jgi:hypothetical protein
VSRGFLRWFYVSVQFVMLAVSIPKVATLFHAYDQQSFGLAWGGIDIRSWMVGIVIDLCSAVTTMAALAKYEESRRRLELLAPAVIIAVCTGLSVVANYEDAATLQPEQYANISLFTHPALLINPILISAPPILVLLLILLVPSIMARSRIKTAAEIEAEANEQVALIAAKGRVSIAKAERSAQVLSARIQGFQANVNAAVGKVEERALAKNAEKPRTLPEAAESDVPTVPTTRAVWNTLSLKERVIRSGLISPQEIAEVLGISLTHARNLTREVKAEAPSVPGRTGVPYQTLIDALYDKRTRESFAQAHKLESVLGGKKRLQVLANPEDLPETETEEAQEA